MDEPQRRRTPLQTRQRRQAPDPLKTELERTQKAVKAAYRKLRDLNMMVKRQNIQKIKGIQTLDIVQDTVGLMREIESFLAVFGGSYLRLYNWFFNDEEEEVQPKQITQQLEAKKQS